MAYSPVGNQFSSTAQITPDGLNWRCTTEYVIPSVLSGVTGDGTTDDRGALNTLANTTVPAGGGVIQGVGPCKCIIGSNLTIPANVGLALEKGFIIDGPSGASPKPILTVNGPFEAGPYQCFGSNLQVVFGNGAVAAVCVEWFGANGYGVTDCSAAINAAIAALPQAGGTLRFGQGTFLVTGVISTLPQSRTVTIAGSGRDTTSIYYNPTSTGTLFNFDSGGGGLLLWRSGIVNLSIYSQNSVTKIAIRCVETRDFILRDVVVNFTVSGDTASTALALGGRDEGLVDDFLAYAARPIHVFKNPYGLQAGLDHWTFSNLALYNDVTGTPSYSLIEVDPGCNLSNVRFVGRQAWVGGNGGFYYDSTSDSAGGCNMLELSGFRWEPGSTTPSRPGIYLAPHATKLGKAVLHAFYADVITGNPSAIKMRNMNRVTLRDGQIQGASGLTSYDFDGTCNNLLVDNVDVTQGVTPAITGLTKVFSTGYQSLVPAETERVKFYVNSSNALVDQYFGFFDHALWARQASIANGATVTIPPNNGSLGFCRAKLIVAKGTGSQEEYGEFVITVDTSDGHSNLVVGSSGMAGANTAGKMSVERAVGSDSILVRNNLGQTRSVSIVVEYARGTPII